MDLLQCYSIDFAFLSETWLHNDSNSVTALIESYGYTSYLSCSGRGKGCAMLISSKLSSLCTGSSKYNFNSFDAVSIKLNDSLKTTLICIYRFYKFGSHFNTFLDEFHDFACHLLLNGSNFVLGGDFNIHWNDSDESYTYRFQDLLDELGIQVTAPKVPTQSLGNTLDFILSNVSTSSQIKLQSVESNLCISDHYPILFNIKLLTQPLARSTSKTVLQRNCKNVDIKQFNIDLESSLLELSNINSSFELTLAKFSENISHCLENHAPLMSKVIKPNDFEKPLSFDGGYQIKRA